MDTEEIIRQAKSLQARIRTYQQREPKGYYGEAARAQVCEFFRHYAGPKSAFLKLAEVAQAYDDDSLLVVLISIVQSFTEYVQAGLKDTARN